MTLNASHDFVKPTNSLAFDIQQRGKNQMGMIGHDNRNAQIESLVMSEYAGVQNNIPRPARKLVALLGNESDEMRFVIALIVWQIPPVKAHGAIVADANPRRRSGTKFSRYSIHFGKKAHSVGAALRPAPAKPKASGYGAEGFTC